MTPEGKPHLAWNGVNGAVEYEVYVSDSEDGTYSLLTVTENPEYIAENALFSVAYYYKVKAVDKAGFKSNCSAAVSIATPRIGIITQPTDQEVKDGKKVRVCAKCGKEL